MLEICKYPNWIFHNDRKQPTDHRGRVINALDPANHHTFEEAYELARSAPVAGLGFVFTGNGIVGIDVDNVPSLSENPIEKLMNSYTEVSPSEKGLHIIIKDSCMIPHSIKRGNIEVYADKRFFTVTFESLDHPPKTINERHDELIVLLTILNNTKLHDLWDGNWRKHFDNQSEADMCFVRLLLNERIEPNLIEHIHSLSGLHREKDESMRGELTYIQYTIKKALET